MHNQRTTILYIAVSLDGYIADENGGVSWLEDFPGDGDNGYMSFYETVDTIVMGRNTYDQVMTFDCDWPYAGKACYVFTSRDHQVDDNVEFVSGDVEEFMVGLKSQSGSNIWLLGGAGLSQQFMRKNLIDEYAICIVPVILGKGIALFKENIPECRLMLKEKKQYKDLMMLWYKNKQD